MEPPWWNNICVTTWNCRALLTHDPALFKKKWCIVDAAIRDSDVVVLQEVHGSAGEMQALARRVASTHTAFSSAGVPESAGGILIFVRVRWCESAQVEEAVIVLGRILGVRSVAEATTLAVLGVHNYNVSAGAITVAQRWISDTTARHPGVVLFATGDWNFDESDDGVITTTGRGDTTSHRARREQARWLRALRNLTSLSHGLPTRAAITETADSVAVSQSSLDRTYTSLPPTTLAFTDVRCRVAPVGAVLRQGCAAPPSDHAMVRTTLAVKLQPCLANRPIPSWVTRHPLYAIDVRRRLASLPLEALTVPDAYRRCVQAIRSAAAHTRNACLSRRPRRPEEVL